MNGDLRDAGAVAGQGIVRVVFAHLHSIVVALLLECISSHEVCQILKVSGHTKSVGLVLFGHCLSPYIEVILEATGDAVGLLGLFGIEVSNIVEVSLARLP